MGSERSDGVKPDRVACPEHRDLGPIPTCKACREQAQPNPACRFNGRSTRTCALGTLGCVIDHGNAAGVPERVTSLSSNSKADVAQSRKSEGQA